MKSQSPERPNPAVLLADLGRSSKGAKLHPLPLPKDYKNPLSEADHERQLPSQREKAKQPVDMKYDFNVISYRKEATIRYCKKYDKTIETDTKFIEDVKKIEGIQKDMLLGFLKTNKHHLSDQQCDVIDYIARTHYRANVLNTRTDSSQSPAAESISQPHKCPCGCERFKGEPYPLCEDIQQLNFLGSGVLLLFYFIKRIAICLLLALIVYGIFALVTNFLGSQNHSQAGECQGDGYCEFVDNGTDNNKIDPSVFSVIQWWLGLVYCLIWVLSIRSIKEKGRRKNKTIDQMLDSSSDKSIMVSNLPTEAYTEEELLEYFQRIWHRLKREQLEKAQQKAEKQNWEKVQQARMKSLNSSNEGSNLELPEPEPMPEEFATNFYRERYNPSLYDNGNNFDIRAIQIIYDVEFSRKMVEKVVSRCMSLVSLISEDDEKYPGVIVIEDVEQYKHEKEELIEVLELLNDFRKRFLYDENFRRSISCSLCFVEFKSEAKQREVLAKYGKDKIGLITQLQEKVKALWTNQEGSLLFKGKYLKIERAPEPTDILWKNCEIKPSFKRLMLIYLATFLIIVVSFGVIVGLEFVQAIFVAEPSGSSSTVTAEQADIISVLNIITAISMQIINKVLWISLFYLLELEHNFTMTDKINSQMNKTLFAVCINVILLPIISNYYIKKDVYGINGLSGMAFDYQISMLTIGLGIKLLDPLQIITRFVLYVRCIRNYVIRSLCQNINLKELPEYQVQGVQKVNRFYEGSIFDIAQSYVYILGVIHHAAFFCQLQPTVLYIATIISILFYWVMKINLLHFSKIPEMTEKLIFETACNQAAIVPITFGMGTIVTSYFGQQVEPDRPLELYQAILCIAIGLFNFFNPGGVMNILMLKVMNVFDLLKETVIKPKIKHEEQAGPTFVPDSYYKHSNSLDLLGFEAKIKGLDHDKDICDELERFCRSFVPKEDNTEQENSNEKKLKARDMRDSGKRVLVKSSKKKKGAGKGSNQKTKMQKESPRHEQEREDEDVQSYITEEQQEGSSAMEHQEQQSEQSKRVRSQRSF